jgi:hypothetical protein
VITPGNSPAILSMFRAVRSGECARSFSTGQG